MALHPKSYGAFDFGLEATAGTAVAPGALGMEFASAEITDTPVTGSTESIGGLKRTNSYVLGRDVSYSASGSVFASTIGYLCAHGHGGVTESGSDPYTHTWVGGDYSDPDDWETMTQAWSLSESQNDMGESSAHARRAAGCICSDFELSSSHRSEAGVTWSISGNGYSVGEYAGAVSASIPSTNPLLHDDATFKIGLGAAGASGTAVPVEEFTVTVNHNSQTIPGKTGNAQGYDTAGIFPGMQDVKATVKIPMDNTVLALWDEISANTRNAADDYVSFYAQWTWGDTDEYSFTIEIDKATLANSPFEGNDVASGGAYYWTLELQAYGATPLKLTLVDDNEADTYHYTA